MSKHTPGPWDYGWEIQPNGCPTVGHKGLMVCMVAHSAKDPEQKETALANANLIAAAPDLLEALEYALSMWGDYLPPGNSNAMKAIKQSRAAIAKARGDA